MFYYLLIAVFVVAVFLYITSVPMKNIIAAFIFGLMLFTLIPMTWHSLTVILTFWGII